VTNEDVTWFNEKIRSPFLRRATGASHVRRAACASPPRRRRNYGRTEKKAESKWREETH